MSTVALACRSPWSLHENEALARHSAMAMRKSDIVAWFYTSWSHAPTCCSHYCLEARRRRLSRPLRARRLQEAVRAHSMWAG